MALSVLLIFEAIVQKRFDSWLYREAHTPGCPLIISHVISDMMLCCEPCTPPGAAMFRV